MRIPFLQREKATYIKLRRLGYSINTIAQAFGRSFSVIYRVLKRHGLTWKDLRKLPRQIKQLAAQRQRMQIIHYLNAWEMWALGEGDKPP